MSILSALAQIAGIFASAAGSMATQVGAPSDLPGTIHVEPATQSGGTSSVKVNIDHPAAAAYEWGSGIHATKGGKKEKYLIPKKPTGVAFPKEKWENYDPGYYNPARPAPDVFVFDQVKHPGVEKRPYLKPAFDEHKVEFEGMLVTGFEVDVSAKGQQEGNTMETVEVIIG
jgi:hypothetical protein